MGRVNEVAAALQDLKATCVRVEDEEKHPCDAAFSEQAETVSHACADLSQQVRIKYIPEFRQREKVSESDHMFMHFILKQNDKWCHIS